MARQALIPEDLAALPMSDPYRNVALVVIGAQYRWRESKLWKEVKPTYGIANKTFNELGPAWTEFDIWKATICLDNL